MSLVLFPDKVICGWVVANWRGNMVDVVYSDHNHRVLKMIWNSNRKVRTWNDKTLSASHMNPRVVLNWILTLRYILLFAGKLHRTLKVETEPFGTDDVLTSRFMIGNSIPWHRGSNNSISRWGSCRVNLFQTFRLNIHQTNQSPFSID